MKDITFNELSDIEKRALEEAEKVRENAYNPYSHFYVGACLYTDKGEIICGTNVENANYDLTLCSERAAVFRAHATGIKKFKGIVVIARGKDFDTQEVTAPCGSCRQVLYEVAQLSGGDLDVVLSTTRKDKIMRITIKELLPLAFGPLDLGIDIEKYRRKQE